MPGRQPPAPTTRPHAGAGRPEHLECPLNTPPSTLDARPTSVDGVRLRDLVALVPDVVPAGVPGADPTITGLSLDSQAARPGDLYAALAGSRTHGARYAKAAVAAGAVAVLVTLVTNGLTDAIIILVAVLIVQQVEGNLLYPYVVGSSLELHPLLILLALAGGTAVAGVVGALIAVPVAAVASGALSYLSGREPPDAAPVAQG